MNKNILVLTGSPNINGNTDRMADAFIKGAKETGHNVTKFNAGTSNIKGCTSCNKCFSKGDACTTNDDFNNLSPLIEKADVIVFASPVYWFTFTTQIKAALDKIHSFAVGNRSIADKKCLLLSCAASPTEEVFNGITTTFKQIAQHLNWRVIKMLLAPGLYGKDDILKTDFLVAAEAIGKSI